MQLITEKMTLIGKTIADVKLCRIPNFSDTPFMKIVFTDDTYTIIEASYDDTYTGKSMGEYTLLISIANTSYANLIEIESPE